MGDGTAVVADGLVLASDTLSERLLLALSERLLFTLETWASGPVWPGTGGGVDDTAIDVDSPAAMTAPSRVIPTLSHQIALAGVIRLVRNGTSIPMRHAPWPAKAAALHSDVVSIGMPVFSARALDRSAASRPALTPCGGIVTPVMPTAYGRVTAPSLRPLLRDRIGDWPCHGLSR